MQILDVNQMVQYYLTSLELVVIFATVCAALELTFPAYRYSFASYVGGVRNWIIWLGWGTFIWHLYSASLGWLGIKPLVNQFRCFASL
ncbi:hypothetical protein NKJ74_23230 [Mesorhizobium sp. M0046]|uniref:hypothetical protein n=1 Tax=Mesorhizobium sp. M0046 TaxID=2956858 RepID=UPI00333D975F